MLSQIAKLLSTEPISWHCCATIEYLFSVLLAWVRRFRFSFISVQSEHSDQSITRAKRCNCISETTNCILWAVRSVSASVTLSQVLLFAGACLLEFLDRSASDNSVFCRNLTDYWCHWSKRLAKLHVFLGRHIAASTRNWHCWNDYCRVAIRTAVLIRFAEHSVYISLLDKEVANYDIFRSIHRLLRHCFIERFKKQSQQSPMRYFYFGQTNRLPQFRNRNFEDAKPARTKLPSHSVASCLFSGVCKRHLPIRNCIALLLKVGSHKHSAIRAQQQQLEQSRRKL